MLEALLGGGLGALARLAPEVLKFLDRKNERLHELALGEQAFKVQELNARSKMEVAAIDAHSSQFVAALEALRAAVTGQATVTGVRWVDALSASVRPILTYGFAACYLGYKMKTGTWAEADTAIFSGILNFWFMGRVFDKVLR